MSETTTGIPATTPEEATVDRWATATHPASRPIPMWPEGALALAAGITLFVIGYRHRFYLQRKALEIQRAAEEFQRQGGTEELAQLARQASEFLRGGGR